LAWQVGAPPEVATLLEEIGRERCAAAAAGGEVGLDPELDEFMVRQALITRARTTRFACSNSCAVITCDRRDGGGAQEAYCGVLERYKEELSRPFDEAASFLSSVRTQLSTLCGGAASLSGNPPLRRSLASPLPSSSQAICRWARQQVRAGLRHRHCHCGHDMHLCIAL